MMRTVLCVLWLSALLSCRAVLEEEWEEWKEEHGKVYHSASEEASAREVWTRRRDFVHAHNSRDDVTFTLGMNEFSDQETKVNPSQRNSHALRYKPEVTSNFFPRAPPHSFDWRKQGVISPVRNQGLMGRPGAIAVTEDLESLHAIKTGKLESLSVQEVIDCCSHPEGMLVSDIYECIARHGGLCAEGSYPHSGPGTPQCRNDSCQAAADDAKVTVHIPRGDEDAMLTAVLQRPLVVYIDASKTSFEMYRTGVYQDTGCSDTPDHVLQLVGYGIQNSLPYWILKNSWGATWGMKGYVLMRRGINMCGVADYALYPQ